MSVRHNSSPEASPPSTQSLVLEIEDRVFRTLYDHTCGEYAAYISTIASSLGISKEITRVCLRSLVDRGLANYVRGLMREDCGDTAGSGYTISEKGADICRSWKEEK